MDLIYADPQGVDIGIFRSYTFDLAYGEDENSFTITIPREMHCCGDGYYIYRDDGEDGGIVDRVSVDTVKETVTYAGRTWHGILASKVLCPDEGQDYLTLRGEANAVLGQVIQRIGLTAVFAASSEASGITVAPYQMDRYVDAYTGIRKMLRESDAKLRIRRRNRTAVLSAIPRNAYTWSEDLDSSQVGLAASHAYRAVNHLICLGGGDLAERAVIHLFTDENGGLQPYAVVDPPLQDGDYILDDSQKVISGEKEITAVLDYPSADRTQNYIPLPAEPSDWTENCTDYYTGTADGYAPVVRENVTVYKLQRVAPSDWAVNCGAYYKKSGSSYAKVTTTAAYTVLSTKPDDFDDDFDEYYTRNGSSYVKASGTKQEQYVAQTRKPRDWSRKWSAYYFLYSDGVSSEYRRVDGISHDKYLLQTQCPTDWASHYNRYYQKKKNGGYEAAKAIKDAAPEWKPKTYYTRQTYETAPAWVSGTYYTYQSYIAPPAWASGTYYSKDDDTAPAWASGTYYTKKAEDRAPRFASGNFFRAVTDRYAALVEAGIERLRQEWECDELSVSASAVGRTYDIGDIVGAADSMTGIAVTQEVVKKIVRIENGVDSEEYILK